MPKPARGLTSGAHGSAAQGGPRARHEHVRDGRGPLVSDPERGMGVIGVGRLRGGVHWSRAPSTSAPHTTRAPWPRPAASHGAAAVGRGASARQRSAVAGVHRRLVNGEGRTDEREKEVRWGNSPRMRRGWRRSSERRWWTTVRNSRGTLHEGSEAQWARRRESSDKLGCGRVQLGWGRWDK